MTINAQSGPGRICLFNDFFGIDDYVAKTEDSAQAGDFFIGGEGFEDNDAGAITLTSDGLSGVVELTSGNTDDDTVCIATGIGFDVALMGTLVLEARVRFVDLDNKAAFVGFTSACGLDPQLGTDIIDYSAGTTITLTASSLCGFYLSSELTDDEDWHAVYNGGSTTGETTSSNIDLDDDAVAGEFQVLRVEIDNNGTARWYIDGVLLKTLAGAISTTTDLAAFVGTCANTSDYAVMDVDYVLVEANRDWNA